MYQLAVVADSHPGYPVQIRPGSLPTAQGLTYSGMISLRPVEVEGSKLTVRLWGKKKKPMRVARIDVTHLKAQIGECTRIGTLEFPN